MSQREPKANYWQGAPMPRHQLVLITKALEDMVPENHPVRLVDEILNAFRQMIKLAIDLKIAEALSSLENQDSWEQDLLGQAISADRLPAAISDLQERREQLAEHMKTAEARDENRRRLGTKGPAQIPKTDPDAASCLTKKAATQPISHQWRRLSDDKGDRPLSPRETLLETEHYSQHSRCYGSSSVH
ncbi:hypothetical protein [Novipirellula artificiosorum]|uniref:Uncharacterized protein n=1 Tax=Novipirellula artificiosorum TaxID=2528016 RepID=A0A5C6D929_9BACT|nr:hypothetical protein [Novipirellula artificiosorum]TWU31359.1 hypothetical protein Poly41_62280 [Novipirellula artificiosorum]